MTQQWTSIIVLCEISAGPQLLTIRTTLINILKYYGNTGMLSVYAAQPKISKFMAILLKTALNDAKLIVVNCRLLFL